MRDRCRTFHWNAINPDSPDVPAQGTIHISVSSDISENTDNYENA